MPDVSPVEVQTTEPSVHLCMCGTMAVERQGTPETHFTFRRYITNVQGKPWVGTKSHMCSAVVKCLLCFYFCWPKCKKIVPFQRRHWKFEFSLTIYLHKCPRALLARISGDIVSFNMKTFTNLNKNTIQQCPKLTIYPLVIFHGAKTREAIT